MVDAPHGTEQADEGGGRTDRGQHGQAGLHARRGFVDAVAQRTGGPVAQVERVVQLRLGVAMVGDGFAAFEREVAEGVARVLVELVHAFGEVGAVPERIDGHVGLLAVAAQIQRLDDDHHPGGQRHDKQQHGRCLDDDVTLIPNVGQAKLKIHDAITPLQN